MRNLSIRFCAIFLVALLTPNLAHAQALLEEVCQWDFTNYSDATVANLQADTEHWTYNSKGRYLNAVPTDGLPLKANGVEIEETSGVIIGAGVAAGSFLLRHAMGTNNGMQIERATTVTFGGTLAGDVVEVSLMSSSKTAKGIDEITNMTGDYGSEFYAGTSPKTYSFTVVEDGEVSFKNSPGVVIKTIVVKREANSESEKTQVPVITVTETPTQVHDVTRSFKTVEISAVDGADIFYSTDPKASLVNYLPYTTPVFVTRTCEFQAFALKEGLRASDVVSSSIDVPLEMPYKGQPYILDPERLDRGAIVTKGLDGDRFLVNWRMLYDDGDVTFNVLRDNVKLNETPISATNFEDASGSPTAKYTVEVIKDGVVTETAEALMLENGYLEIPLQRPAGGSTPSGNFEYVPGDCMVADLDGDNVYEVVMKWDPNNADEDNSDSNDKVGAGQKDNSIAGYTGNVLIDAYRLDGTMLWRIDLGRNIRAGAHYTQLMVYDLDGDGKAEVACKTAPGTIDASGKFVILGDDNPDADYRNSKGYIPEGPEYLTVFEGTTGNAIATVNYQPARTILSAAEWGDNYNNRSDRYLACVAYLNGESPSLVMCRGYYTAAYIWAVDFDGSELSTRWLLASVESGVGAYGEGAHSISVGDVDGDGCDEIIYGSCSIDHDGTMLYRTGLGHGDALHCGDFNPDRPGLEVMMVHEETNAKYGIEMRDALTGEVLSGVFTGTDVGRGLCADIDPEVRGCEYWGYDNNVYDVDGNLISTKKPTINFRTYWDGDYYEELTEKGAISKWSRSGNKSIVSMVSKYGCGTDLIKYTPNLQADIFGDWREEQIYYDAATKSKLMIFSTPYPTDYSMPTLMHDHHYRMATVWQTTAYNQPPHLSFYLPDYLEANESGIVDVLMPSHGDVICLRYYDLSGRRLSDVPSAGFYIVERIFSDGTVTTEKILRN